MYVAGCSHLDILQLTVSPSMATSADCEDVLRSTSSSIGEDLVSVGLPISEDEVKHFLRKFISLIWPFS